MKTLKTLFFSETRLLIFIKLISVIKVNPQVTDLNTEQWMIYTKFLTWQIDNNVKKRNFGIDWHYDKNNIPLKTAIYFHCKKTSGIKHQLRDSNKFLRDVVSLHNDQSNKLLLNSVSLWIFSYYKTYLTTSVSLYLASIAWFGLAKLIYLCCIMYVWKHVTTFHKFMHFHVPKWSWTM